METEFQLDTLDKTNTNEEVYKIWSKAKDISRFLSIKYFKTGKKFVIDIGMTDGSNSLKSSTSVYVDAVTLLAYVNSIVNGTAKEVYQGSSDHKKHLQTDESLATFGGGKIDGNPIARIFKAHYWKSGENYDTSAFAWKCAHFPAKESATGAFIQSDSKPISSDSIKVTRRNIHEMSIILNATLMKDLLS